MVVTLDTVYTLVVHRSLFVFPYRRGSNAFQRERVDKVKNELVRGIIDSE